MVISASKNGVISSFPVSTLVTSFSFISLAGNQSIFLSGCEARGHPFFVLDFSANLETNH